MGCTCAHGTKLRARDTNLCVKTREWNQETALQLKSAHLIMCFDCAACPTAHKRSQLDAVQVGNLMHAGSLQLLLLLRRTFEAC